MYTHFIVRNSGFKNLVQNANVLVPGEKKPCTTGNAPVPESTAGCVSMLWALSEEEEDERLAR